jgi:DNA-binding response OmpR family regulator
VLHAVTVRVLIADDDDDQRRLLSAQLAASVPGAIVDGCIDGRSTLDALRKDAISVILLDLAMPGPSGMDLVRHVRAIAPETPVIIVTGAGSGPDRAAARELGVRRFLVKPYELDELVGAVREALDSSPRRAEEGS